MKSYSFFLLVFLLALASCNKIVSNNPFDPECPKELFTPSGIQAATFANGIQLNWNQVDNNISGYTLSKTLGNGTKIVIGNFPKDSTSYYDTSVELGKQYNYTLFAFAGNNQSNGVYAQITPTVFLATTSPTQITTTTAILGGITATANGVSISQQWFLYGELKSGSNTSTGGTSNGANSYNITLNNLIPNTSYVYQAFIYTSQNVKVYGNKVVFTTLALSTANVKTLRPTLITSSSAIIGDSIVYNGGSSVTENGVVYSTSQNPTTNDTKVVNTSGNNFFTSTISGLTPNTTYYVRSYAINNLGVSYGNQVSFTTSKKTINTGSVSDIDGNSYKTITIGSQIWMASNLQTTSYNDGTPIANVTDSLLWGNVTTGAYCSYYNSVSNYRVYGALYNFYAVNTGNLCPTGWHVPTKTEWETLITFLGGTSSAGGAMKEIGNAHWISPNTGATNSSGFTALPGGIGTLTNNGKPSFFIGLGSFCYWWSSTLVPSQNVNYNPAYDYEINGAGIQIGENADFLNYGESVRCVGN